jgi:hypothetical protein
MRWGNSGQLRGAVFEALVRHWAVTAGYVPVKIPDARHPEPKDDAQLFDLHGLPMVHGIGEGHNADVLLEYPVRLALTPKLRLLIECKGYNGRVGLPVIRGAVGLRADVNAFRQLSNDELAERRLTRRPPRTPQQFPHYHLAVASLFGFSDPAQSYAAAHHIELLDYSGLPILGNIARVVSRMQVAAFSPGEVAPVELDGNAFEEDGEPVLPAVVSTALSAALDSGHFEDVVETLARAGVPRDRPGIQDLERVFGAASSVRASYTATLANGLHFHMLARRPVSIDWRLGRRSRLRDADLEFEIYYDQRETRSWHLAVGGLRLEFALPRVLLNAWRRGRDQQAEAAIMKDEHFRRVDIVGPVETTPNGRPQIRHLVGILNPDFLRRALRAAGVFGREL